MKVLIVKKCEDCHWCDTRLLLCLNPDMINRNIVKNTIPNDCPLPNKECDHSDAYHFHDNAPRYCPDCDKYL